MFLSLQDNVSFDNIGRALLQVLQVVSLESWSTTQMYYLFDGIGNVVIIYYMALVVIGTYFALNLLVAVISAKFAQLHVSTANLKHTLLSALPAWATNSCLTLSVSVSLAELVPAQCLPILMSEWLV